MSSRRNVAVGDAIGTLEFGPISRLTLALFCGGAADHNPIHVDSDYARAAGLNDVVVHGMLQMAVLARLVSQWVPQEHVRAFSARFIHPVSVLDTLRCTGIVAEIREEQERRFAVLKLTGVVKADVTVISGTATIELLRDGHE